MERATLIIEKSIPPKTRAEVKELFKNTDTGRFKYIVVAWLAYWHYRNYKPPPHPSERQPCRRIVQEKAKRSPK